MNRKDRVDLQGALLLLFCMLLMGLNQSAIKIVNEGLGPLFQSGLRSLFAFPLILAWALWRGKFTGIDRSTHLPGIICGIFFAVEFILLFQALEFTSVVRTSIFFYVMPFWVALGAHFLIPGETLTRQRIFGLVLAFSGVIIALSVNHAPATKFALIGDLMSLVGSMFWAGIALVVRTTNLSKVSPEGQLFYQLFVSAIILVPLALLVGDVLREPTIFHWIIFAFQVVVIVCVAFLTWFYVLSVYPASDMASFSFLAPLFGVLFGWLLLDEPLSWHLVVALILVGTGIVLVNRKRR